VGHCTDAIVATQSFGSNLQGWSLIVDAESDEEVLDFEWHALGASDKWGGQSVQEVDGGCGALGRDGCLVGRSRVP
jgi:hypothetical protein